MPPKKYWKKLKDEIENSAEGNIVISAEEFGVVRDLKSTVPLMASLLSGCNTKIIVYLRRADDFLQSVYNQAVKGSEARYTGEFWEYVKPILEIGGADYLNVLMPFANAFGKDAIMVRPYEKEQMHNGIVEDFLNCLGVELSPNITIPEIRENLSLSRENLEILRHINRVPLTPDQHKVVVDCLTRNQNSMELVHTTISPAERLKILESVKESSEIVASEFLGRESGELFYAPDPDPGEPWNTNCLPPSAEVLATVTSIWAELARTKGTSSATVIKSSLTKAIKQLVT
jgi:hypothetical protein